MISRETILEHYHSQLALLTARYPLARWAIQPAGVGITRSKARYGECLPDGQVLISPYYILTESHNHLKHTLCHEFAHLAVGLEHCHNQKFRHMERLFKMHLAPCSEAEGEAVRANVPFKYRVVAHLQDGSAVELGGVHRKTKCYSQYDPIKRVMSCKGKPVARFEFLPYGKS